MSKYHYIALLFILFSCESTPLEITGKYQEINRNWLERIWLVDLNNTVYPIKETLKINADSTFILTACTIKTGRWIISADSLVLIFETNNWAINRFNISGYDGRCPSLPEQPYKFAIYKDYLLRESLIIIRGKEKKLVQKKRKINT